MNTTITLNGTAFAYSLKAALITASGDDTRPHISAIYIKWDAGRMELVSTDGHRLARYRITSHDGTPEEDAIHCDEKGSMSLPRADAVQWEKALRPAMTRKGLDGDPIVTIGVDLDDEGEGVVTLNAGYSTITSRIGYTGAFPPYERVIPNVGVGGDRAPVGISPAYIADAGKAMAIVAKHGNKPMHGMALRLGGALDPMRADMESSGDHATIGATMVVMPFRIEGAAAVGPWVEADESADREVANG